MRYAIISGAGQAFVSMIEIRCIKDDITNKDKTILHNASQLTQGHFMALYVLLSKLVFILSRTQNDSK